MVDGSCWAWRSILEERIATKAKQTTALQTRTKETRAAQARESTTAEWRLKAFERVLARIDPVVGDAKYLPRPQDLVECGRDSEQNGSPTEGAVLWESLPVAADPCKYMDRGRGLRKRRQIDNLVALLRPLVRPGDHIVDFCGGAGHMSIPLALSFPECTVTLLDAKLASLLLARRRLSACFLGNHKVLLGMES